MMYVSKKESIIKIDGYKDECMSDLYNLIKCMIRSGISPFEILELIAPAARAEEMEGDADDQD